MAWRLYFDSEVEAILLAFQHGYSYPRTRTAGTAQSQWKEIERPIGIRSGSLAEETSVGTNPDSIYDKNSRKLDVVIWIAR